MNTGYTADDLVRELDDHPYDVKTDGSGYYTNRYTLIDPHADEPEFLRFFTLERNIYVEVQQTYLVAGRFPHALWTELAKINTNLLPIEAAAGLIRGYLSAYNDAKAGV